MPDPTALVAADTETPAERFKRIVLGKLEPGATEIAVDGLAGFSDKFKRYVAAFAATMDDTFPAAVIPPAAGGIDDDSAFYGSDDGRPAFVAADDAAWRG